MLLVHLLLAIIPEISFSRITELQEENVVEHHRAWAVKEF
jgi:hypothetical protein